jgi:hypothetical protein
MMSSSLKHLLNPVDEDTDTNVSQVSGGNLASDGQQFNFAGNAPAMTFNMDDSINSIPMDIWDDYNGELPRVSGYLGPSAMNPLA